ncbi:MAG TPA: glucose-6-phosphate dehydrogenase [Armatimonadota bacterium]|mgnify:CR=1 FL=1|nr:glucose-6-phosphate dehydrogenase [Armatimonadota bacterium]
MPADAHTITVVIFGASGDLTERKLIPALFSLFRKGRLPECCVNIVGFSRTPYSHDAFRAHLRDGMETLAPTAFDAEAWRAFAPRLWYAPGDTQTPGDYGTLRALLREIEGGPANRVYYAAVAPQLFPVLAGHLGDAGLADQREGWRRIVIEKPFGTDLASARDLTRALHAVFDEEQIYRMDHYLGKETAQNILFFRFANTIFEPVWNRNYVAGVQISVLEELDVGRRGAYYDQSGVLRDMFQNHLLQLLTLVAMEPPASFDATAIRNEKAKVLSAIQPIAPDETVRGQYAGYRSANGVAPDSHTATYAALALRIANWRWQGVPFLLRSGKALTCRTSEITIEFQRPPHRIFGEAAIGANLLTLAIQPNEGIHLRVQAKTPDQPREMAAVDMEFYYRSYFGENGLPEAYERLLLDVMLGDQSLFPREDQIEITWQLMDPVPPAWAAPGAPPLETYAPGSWGPAGAEALAARLGTLWHLGRTCRLP